MCVSCRCRLHISLGIVIITTVEIWEAEKRSTCFCLVRSFSGGEYTKGTVWWWWWCTYRAGLRRKLDSDSRLTKYLFFFFFFISFFFSTNRKCHVSIPLDLVCMLVDDFFATSCSLFVDLLFFVCVSTLVVVRSYVHDVTRVSSPFEGWTMKQLFDLRVW